MKREYNVVLNSEERELLSKTKMAVYDDESVPNDHVIGEALRRTLTQATNGEVAYDE